MSQKINYSSELISIIVPCYNEENNITEISQRIRDQMEQLDVDYELIFVDDGSIDNTAEIIKSLYIEEKRIKLISFSRNFGHQAAIIAGLNYCSGDCLIMMDADLQHPPELITKMIQKWKSGYDIVNTLREDSKNLSFFKRHTSKGYYKLINIISKTKIEAGSADFRLIDRKVIDSFNEIGEYSLFIRGMINWVGFSSTSIRYKPNERFSGKSKYSLKKMVSFALDGITSFSSAPLQISMVFGLFCSFLSFIYMIYALYTKFFTDQALEGWTSTIISILFIGGIQLISIGILGEYLSKIFYEVKKRPRYIINKKLGFE
jgi:glycosyltransferase involved in cell wall biosynthesis